jgi:hypothetical protein
MVGIYGVGKEGHKIYNRATGIRGYFPLNLECAYENSTTGSVL